MPCWYELSWTTPKVGIVFGIHEDFAKHTKVIEENFPIVRHLQSEFEFKEFEGTFGKDFGFEKSLKFLGTKSGFLEYQIPISLCKKTLDEKCPFCDGIGRDGFGGKCLYCDGKKKKTEYDYTEAFAIAAS